MLVSWECPASVRPCCFAVGPTIRSSLQGCRTGQPFGLSLEWWVVFGSGSFCLTLPMQSITYSKTTCPRLLVNADQISCVFIVHMVPIEELPITRASIVLCLCSLHDSHVIGLDNGKLDFQMKCHQCKRLYGTKAWKFCFFSENLLFSFHFFTFVWIYINCMI